MTLNPLLIELPNQIETPRLLLRPLKVSDDKAYHEACSESFGALTKYYAPEWCKFDQMPDIGYVSLMVRKNIVQWHERSYLEMAAIEKSSNRFIGVGQLHHLDWSVPKGRIGYFVRQTAGGNGFATEIANVLSRFALDRLQFKRLEIRSEVRNTASARIPRSLGYEFQTVFKMNKCGRNGELWDMEIHVRHDTKNLPVLEVRFT